MPGRGLRGCSRGGDVAHDVREGDGHLAEGYAGADVANGVEESDLRGGGRGNSARVVNFSGAGAWHSRAAKRCLGRVTARILTLSPLPRTSIPPPPLQWHGTAPLPPRTSTHRRQRSDVCPADLGQRLQAQRPQQTHKGAGRHCIELWRGERWGGGGASGRGPLVEGACVAGLVLA